MSTRRITLLTDFGTQDGYVGAMKGVIASLAPDALIDDVSHDLAPGDLLGAALTLRRYCRRYPPGSVHVVVVDPGVGSERRALAAACDDQWLVGPDNGVLSLALADAKHTAAAEIVTGDLIPAAASNTFHGRDIFAPAAAHLATGVALTSLGPTLTDPVWLRLPVPTPGAGEVIYIDRFGNLITNLQAAPSAVTIVGRKVPVRRTYAAVGAGELVAVINSDGLLEIAERDGNAARRLGVGRGAAVEITRA